MLIWRKTFIDEENNTSTPSRPQKRLYKKTPLPDGCETPAEAAAPPVALAAADDWWSNDELIQSRHQDSTLALPNLVLSKGARGCTANANLCSPLAKTHR